jgi:hypothetical protein
MKNIIYLSFFLTIISCGKNFDDLNIDPNNPTSVPAEYLLTSAQKEFASQTTGDNHAYFGFLMGQYFSQNNYTEASRYQQNTGATNYKWEWYYANCLYDLTEVRRLVLANPGLDAAVDKNKLAVVTALEAMRYQDMTDIFGPIPYTEALKGAEKRSPKYDSQKDIYLDLLVKLKEASAQIDESAGSFGGADVIYGGDMTHWKKFINSLRMRIAIRMADAEPAAAKAEVEAIFATAFADNADNAYFTFQKSPPNNNSLNQLRVERLDADFGISNVLIDNTLQPLHDPRLAAFADEKVNGGGYAGRPYGQSSANAAAETPDIYSQPSGSKVVREGGEFRPLDVIAPDAVARFMSYAEVCFILAEAKERGWSVPGTATEWYEKGITSSLEEWGTNDASAITDYLAQPEVAYTTAAGDWKQKIGVQKWIALFMQGTQGWCEWRRLDFDKFQMPVDGALSDIGDKFSPLRWYYPVNEQTQNGASYQAALGLLGGADKLSTRLWWDTQ